MKHTSNWSGRRVREFHESLFSCFELGLLAHMCLQPLYAREICHISARIVGVGSLMLVGT